MATPTDTTGPRIILFADIVDSTGLYERLGDDRAQQLITEILHRAGDVAGSHGGTVLKTIGDEIMCRFADAAAAVDAACEMQRVAERGWHGHAGGTLFHIGIHAGSAIEQDGDLYGDAVNVAARLTSIAKPGQILASQRVVDAMTNLSPDRTRTFDRTVVKGKSEEMLIHEIMWQPGSVTALHLADLLAKTLAPQSLSLEYRGTRLELGNGTPEIALGRDEACDIHVASPYASRVHARVIYRRGKFVFVDQSTNGTYIDGNLLRNIFLRHDEYPLAGHGVISLGEAVSEAGEHLIQFRCE